jgi:heme-degrading monooxygenase HmoA
MVARVHHSELIPEKAEEARNLWEHRIIPAMKKQPGFKHVYVLTDAGTRKVTTISLWESEQAAEAWGKSNDHKGLSLQNTDKITKLPVTETFEVSIHG